MKAITLKLVAGTLASLAAMGMTGGAAFATSISEAGDEAVGIVQERQWHAGETVKHPLSVTTRITGWVSHVRAAAGNIAQEAQH